MGDSSDKRKLRLRTEWAVKDGRRKEEARTKGVHANTNAMMLTHVNPLVELVVNDFEETYDVSVTTFLHDSDLLADLLFETAEFVCERCMGGSGEIPPAKKIHLLGAGIVTFYGFDSLRWVAQGGRMARRVDNERTAG